MLTIRKKDPNSYWSRLPGLKKLFWLYFFLLVFEGALRKWVAPQYSAPLLIIRDPVSLMIGLFGAQLVLGANQFLVGLYGLRSYLLMFPVIFIMGENIDQEDLNKFGTCAMWLLLINAPLCVLQYRTSGSSFWNKGAYKGGEQLSFVGEHVRASGTFSFSLGLAFFAALAGAFILYGLVKEGFAKTWLLWAAALALLVTVPTTGQRTAVGVLAGMLACMAIGAFMGVAQFTRALRIIVPILIVSALASLLPVFSQATQSMTDRSLGADRSEGGSAGAAIYKRTLGVAVDAVTDAVDSNQWVGIGLGRGAVAVQAFLNGGNQAVAGEDEFSRDMVEMGPVAGGFYLLFKVLIVVALFGTALACARSDEPLALLLIPLVVETLIFSVPEQPTNGGFIVISAALCIAATRPAEREQEPMLPLALQRQQQALYQRRIQRSRSV
jgi:hypothetical protein